MECEVGWGPCGVGWAGCEVVASARWARFGGLDERVVGIDAKLDQVLDLLRNR